MQAAGGRTLPAAALVCEALLPHAQHLFTTRAWALGRDALPAGRDGWDEVAEAIGVAPDRLSRLRQVHGATVVEAGLECTGLPDADVIVTDRPDLAVVVQAADCVPLLVVDRRTGVVAAAHAGWRGLAAQVPVETVKALHRTYGSRPEDLLVAIGPAIGPCCYEVGGDVRKALERFSGPGASRWFARGPKNATWMFDTWSAARGQLEASGVLPEQIFAAELCTASYPDAFCSYRRDGPSAGRMAAAIRVRGVRQ